MSGLLRSLPIFGMQQNDPRCGQKQTFVDPPAGPTPAVEKRALNAWDEFKGWERCAEKGGRPRDVEKLIEDDVDHGRHDCGH
jgi:hypothetical protein